MKDIISILETIADLEDDIIIDIDMAMDKIQEILDDHELNMD